MIIEIKGVGTVNKGAYLMLLAVKEHFNDKDVFLVSKAGRNFSRSEINRLGLGLLWRTKRKGIEFGTFLNFLPLSLRKILNIYLIKDVQIVLDASGFVYGDQWPVNYIKGHLSDTIENHKHQGKIIILLPQAFGPFTNKDLTKEVEKVVSHSDLVFVRDQISLNYIKDSFGLTNNIYLSPDFTSLLEKKAYESTKEKSVLIIPNFKLIEKTSLDSISVLSFFKTQIEYIQSKDQLVEFLIHEGEKDEVMAKKINNLLKKPISIIIEPNPIKQKEIIAASYAVITGRFHGLVSSLSQAVPSLALSWSHKYKMLLADYKQEKMLLEFEDKEVHKKIDLVLDQNNNEEIRKVLLEESKLQKKLAREMWNKVDNLLF